MNFDKESKSEEKKMGKGGGGGGKGEVGWLVVLGLTAL